MCVLFVLFCCVVLIVLMLSEIDLLCSRAVCFVLFACVRLFVCLCVYVCTYVCVLCLVCLVFCVF